MADISIHFIKEITNVRHNPDNVNSVSFAVISGHSSPYSDEINFYNMGPKASAILYGALVQIEALGADK